MTQVCWLMFVQGLFGAFDTVYYHEFRAKLPAGGARTRAELRVHALRDVIYATLFVSLPFVEWHGRWAGVLMSLLLCEIVLTMTDFVIEVKARQPVGVLPGERVTHGLMAIVYGAFLATLLPELLAWWRMTDGIAAVNHNDVPWGLKVVLACMGVGVLASGFRDMYAAAGLPRGAYPWRDGT